jgi:hypothetical protein
MTAMRECLVVSFLFSVLLAPPKTPGPPLAPTMAPLRYASQFLEKLLAKLMGRVGVKRLLFDFSPALDQVDGDARAVRQP